MVDQRERSLILLARIQAMLSAAVAVTILALLGLNPGLLANFVASLSIAILSVAGVVYYLTLHQVLAKKRRALSTLILTVITAANFVLVIATTGGLDSPFYSLWLLAIVVAGIFGTVETIAVLGVTLAYYAYALIVQGLQAPYIRDHVIQLGITVIAAGLAEWVHSRSRRASATKSKLETLSGQLTEEQLKAQALMASIGEGVMVVNTQRQIQLFNKAAQDLTGWDEASAQTIDYKLVLQLHDAADKELAEANDPFNETWTTKKTVVRDNLSMTTRAGRKIALSLSISPIYDNAGAPTGAIALFRDISREKAIERQKEEFVSTASHEMRTPVAAIEGYISLAMNANVATIDDRALKYLTKAHDTIQHLGELFRDLLSATKAEEGSLNVKISAVNLSELVQGAVDDMQFTAQKKSLTLSYQASGATGKVIAPIYHVAANPERLREVIMNLIDNAIKFTPQGGVNVTLNGNDKETQVDISDSGVGIAAEDIPHLFQKFYRIDNSATRTIGGTGLGLYLCRTIIELFNGRIWITSKPGEGSTFHFSLPRLSKEEIARLEQPAAASVAAPSTAVPTGTLIAPNPAPAPAAIPMPVPGGTAGPAITVQPIATAVPADRTSHHHGREVS